MDNPNIFHMALVNWLGEFSLVIAISSKDELAVVVPKLLLFDL